MVVGSQVAYIGVVSFHWTNTSLMVDDAGDAHVGPKLLLVVAKWNLLHPTREGWFEFGTQFQSPSLSRKHENRM
jgi:hypothetical protein